MASRLPLPDWATNLTEPATLIRTEPGVGYRLGPAE